MTPTKTHSACGRCVVARCAIPIGSPLARLSAEVRCQGEAIGAGRTQFENGLTVWAASRTADLSLLGWPHHAASLLSGRRHRYHPTDAKAVLHHTGFWFEVKQRRTYCYEGKGIVWIKECQVLLKTEKQATTSDGRHYDAHEDDPLAIAFAGTSPQPAAS